MPTEKPKAASRANGAKIHGPTTPEGKLKSARNSFRHGLLAKAIVFEGEPREQFAVLLKAFCDELQPQGPIEDLFVRQPAALRTPLGAGKGQRFAGPRFAGR